MGAMAAMAFLLAVTATPPLPVEGQIVPAPRVPARSCRDLLGFEAECGARFPNQVQCYAADAFGRCDGDPKCFAPDGTQTRCVLPVRWIDPCPHRSIIALDDRGLVTKIASHTTPARLCPPQDKVLPF